MVTARVRPRAWILSAAVLIAAWLLASIPRPGYFLADPDGGVFIAGAARLLQGLGLPQVDFDSVYGPACYLLRSLVQGIVGRNLLAEVLVVCAAYGLGYWALFQVLRRAAGSDRVAFALLALALLALPRFYKFQVVLVPALALWAATAWAAGPTWGRSLLLGASLGLGALFRYDLAAYSGCGVAVLLLAAPAGWRQGLRWAPWVVAGAGLAYAPWLAVLLAQGALGDNVRALFGATYGPGGGMGLPHPLLHWESPAISLCFLVVHLLPVLLAWRLLRVWRIGAPADRALAACTAAIAAASLAQASHRADLPHLLQAAPAGFIALAWCLRPGLGFASWRSVLLVAGVGAAVALASRGQPRAWIGSRDLACAWAEPAALLASRERSLAPSQTEVALAIRRHSRPEERVAVFPFASQLAWWADRGFGGRALVLAPGHGQAPESQERMIHALERDGVVLVAWDEAYTYDDDPARRPVATHARLHAWVQGRGRVVERLGSWVFYRLGPASGH